MRPIILAAGLILACAIPPAAVESASIPISVRSHNRSSVDVYLLCGDRDAQWLGVVDGKGGELFEIPLARTACASGLNFFLVHRERHRGYWVGPFRPRAGASIHLTIEKYAALSAARVSW